MAVLHAGIPLKKTYEPPIRMNSHSLHSCDFNRKKVTITRPLRKGSGFYEKVTPSLSL